MGDGSSRVPERRFQVRPARSVDLAQVIAIDCENTGLTKAAYWEDLFSRYHGPTAAEDGAAGNQRFFLVASEGEAVLGFIIGEVRAWEFGSPPCGWVFAIGVRGTVRQGGIGNTLFEAICDRFRRAGVLTVRTMLARDDTLVMSFFRSQGMMAGPFIQFEKDL